MNVNIACPEGYRPDPKIMAMTEDIAKSTGCRVMVTDKPEIACKDAHVIVTDTFVSMGQEEEAQKRLTAFAGYQVNEHLMGLADPSAVFLHCLPRHKEEVNDAVFYSDKSLVFPEAENRMWTVMAVMMSQLGK